MEIVILVLVYLVVFGLSSVILGASLWIMSDKGSNPFQEDGRAVTYGKCAGIVLVT